MIIRKAQSKQRQMKEKLRSICLCEFVVTRSNFWRRNLINNSVVKENLKMSSLRFLQHMCAAIFEDHETLPIHINMFVQKTAQLTKIQIDDNEQHEKRELSKKRSKPVQQLSIVMATHFEKIYNLPEEDLTKISQTIFYGLTFKHCNYRPSEREKIRESSVKIFPFDIYNSNEHRVTLGNGRNG